MINLLNKDHSLLNQFIAELRDVEIQKDRMRFRRNMERIGEIAAYEISKRLKWKMKEVTTPFGAANVPVLEEQPVLATILRAGMPLHQGLLNFFDHADSAYISAYRKPKKSGNFNVKIEYTSIPDVEGRIVIVSDPMLATGNSMYLTCKEIMDKGKVDQLHILAVIASAEGVDLIRKNLPKANLWLGAIDEELTTQSYIVPGLGDAGDLAYGEKM